MSITDTRFDTPLGEMICVADDVAVRLIDFIDRHDIEAAVKRALTPSPAYSRERAGVRAGHVTALAPALNCESSREYSGEGVSALARRQILDYFDGTRQTFDFPLAQPGTAFQHRCWRALEQIPFAQTQTYTQQTLTFAAITSLRAVAQANAHNFCAIVIPCHRVIGTSGDLRGYGGGVERKRWLIEHERAIAMGEGHVPSTLFATR